MVSKILQIMLLTDFFSASWQLKRVLYMNNTILEEHEARAFPISVYYNYTYQSYVSICSFGFAL